MCVDNLRGLLTRPLQSVALSMALVACSGAADEPPSPEAPPTVAPTPAAEPETAAAVEADPAASALALGYASVSPVSDEARRHNREALSKHGDQDYAGSLAGFDAALAAAPGYTLAAFNRACALSRLGRLSDSAAALRPLIERDPAEIIPKVREDADLQALRDDASFAALSAHIERVTAAFATSVAAGVPAFVYEPAAPPSGNEPQPAYRRVRVGVYLPRARRFLPVAPVTRNTLGAMVDVTSGHALVISGQLRNGSLWVVQPRRPVVQIFALDAPGRSVVRRGGLHGLVRNADFHELQAQLAEGGDAALVRFFEVEYARGDNPTFRVATEGAMPPHADGIETSAAYLFVHGEGAGVQRPIPEGFSYHGGSVRIGEHAVSAPGHARRGSRLRALVLDDGARALLVSTRQACNDDMEGPATHRADLVDLATSTVTSLGRGAGSAHAELGPDGSVFVQLGPRAARLPSGESSLRDDVLEGVRFALPIAERDCSI